MSRGKTVFFEFFPVSGRRHICAHAELMIEVIDILKSGLFRNCTDALIAVYEHLLRGSDPKADQIVDRRSAHPFLKFAGKMIFAEACEIREIIERHMTGIIIFHIFDKISYRIRNSRAMGRIIFFLADQMQKDLLKSAGNGIFPVGGDAAGVIGQQMVKEREKPAVRSVRKSDSSIVLIVFEEIRSQRSVKMQIGMCPEISFCPVVVRFPAVDPEACVRREMNGFAAVIKDSAPVERVEQEMGIEVLPDCIVSFFAVENRKTLNIEKMSARIFRNRKALKRGLRSVQKKVSVISQIVLQQMKVDRT